MYERFDDGAAAAAAFTKIAEGFFAGPHPHIVAGAVAAGVNVGIQMQYKPKDQRDLMRAARNGAMLGVGASIAMEALSKHAADPSVAGALAKGIMRRWGPEIVGGLAGVAATAGTVGLLGRRRKKDNTSYLEREARAARKAYDSREEAMKREKAKPTFAHDLNDLRTSFMERQAKLIANHPKKTALLAVFPTATVGKKLGRGSVNLVKRTLPRVLRKVQR